MTLLWSFQARNYTQTGNYLGASHAPLGARFPGNFCLGVMKFGQLPIDVIKNHGFRRMNIGSN